MMLKESINNPYIVGSPVTGTAMFFGREDVFQFVRHALVGQHRDNVLVLYGQQRTGKTSVLYQMRNHMDERYLCIFIDMHSFALDGLDGFLWELASSITRMLRREYQIRLALLERGTFQADSRASFEHDFLPSLWSILGERHLLLMLDEVNYLQEQVRAGKMQRDVFSYLRYLTQHYEQLNFLFSLGSGVEELEKDYAFLFHAGIYKRISFLEKDAATDLITRPVEDCYEVSNEAVDKIYRLTSGHPYYIQLLCHSLFAHWQQFKMHCIESRDIDTIFPEAVEHGSTVLKYTWEELSTAERAFVVGMVTAMGGRSRAVGLKDIALVWQRAGITIPEHEQAQALRGLLAREVIVGTTRYQFTIDLLRQWIQTYQRIEWVKEEVRSVFPLPALPGATRWRGRQLVARLGLIAAVLLVVAGIGARLFYADEYLPQQQRVQAATAAKAQGTVTSRTDATATVAIATANAVAAQHPPYPPRGASLIFDDPLVSNNEGYEWDKSTNCQFQNNGYQVIAPTQYTAYCMSNKNDISNFVFEVRMTILAGYQGGLIFRADMKTSTFYDWDIDSTGAYVFSISTSPNNDDVGASGAITDFQTGLNQTNVLAVEALGDQLTFYANYHYITTISYYQFSHGQIGLEANSSNTSTAVQFSDAKVWKI